MDITPRPYQEEILQSTQDLYRNGDNRIMWYMATGLGKSMATMFLPERFPDLFEQGMIFITHRREILFDAKDRFEEAFPDKWIGLEMGEHHATGMEDIVFASTQSLGRVISDRIKKYRNRQFGIIITDECFTYNTSVQLPNGKKEKIGKLVNQEYDGNVLSWNEELGQFEKKKVIGWVKKETSKDILNVKLGRNGSINCTETHEFYTTEGKKEARELEAGDKVISNSCRDSHFRLNEAARQVTLGSYLGDGYLARAHGESLGSRLRLQHKRGHEEYLDWKAEAFGVKMRESVGTSGYTGRDDIERRQTPTTADISEIEEMEDYEVVDELDELGLAVYYLDDGSFSAGSMKISAYSLSELALDRLIFKFDSFGIDAFVTRSTKGPSIKIRAFSQKKFSRLIAPYTPECMRYKLRGDYSDIPVEDIAQEKPEEELLVVRSVSRTDKNETVYCLEVEDNHNFVLGNSAVVSNCHHATSNSTWDNILNYFRVGSKRDPDYRMPSGDKPLSLFLTATPTRNDGQSLAPFLDGVAADGGFDILYGIRNGWLTDIRARQIVDKSQVSGKELATDSEIDFLTKIVRDYCADHRTLCFARSVDQSKMLRNTLHENEIVPAAHVDAETDKDIRDHIFTWFDREKPALLTNRLVVTEGYDNPGITCLLDNGPTESTPLHLQKLGRGLRPSPDANVDAYDTAEERKQAIKESDKDALLYICTFDPTDHGMDVVASITGTENAVDAEGSLVVEEVVDYIQNVEEEQPERPIRDIDSISDLENEVRQVDLWSQTVYNEDLKTITPLQWVLEEDAASLYLEENPVAERPYEQCPVIVRFEETEDGVEKYLIEVGGYIPSLGHPRKASVNHVGEGEDLHESIQKFDYGLKRKDPSLFNGTKRGGSQPASEKQKDYMRRNGIDFAQNVSEEVAELQIANYKIQRKLDKLDWHDE